MGFLVGFSFVVFFVCVCGGVGLVVVLLNVFFFFFFFFLGGGHNITELSGLMCIINCYLLAEKNKQDDIIL